VGEAILMAEYNNIRQHQVEGFDHNETIAPVAEIISVRCFFLVAVTKG